MDFFTWPHLQKNSVPQDNNVTSFWASGNQSPWQWDDNYSMNYINIPQIIPFDDLALNSPDSFQSLDSFSGSNYADSNLDASPGELSPDKEQPSDFKAVGRPRAPLPSGKDPNENRIQRRRTQNRNSQRVYRQRRIEERNLFEARATAAEESSAQLEIKIGVLETQVAELMEQIRGLEVENAKLRDPE